MDEQYEGSIYIDIKQHSLKLNLDYDYCLQWRDAV